MAAEEKKYEVLTCRCADCTHWEFIRLADEPSQGMLRCLTCNLRLPMAIIQQGQTTVLEFGDHHMLHWKRHEI